MWFKIDYSNPEEYIVTDLSLNIEILKTKSDINVKSEMKELYIKIGKYYYENDEYMVKLLVKGKQIKDEKDREKIFIKSFIENYFML